MNHTQRLAICEVCKNKEFSSELGVVCALTSKQPSFEGLCYDFVSDPAMVAKKSRERKSRGRISTEGGRDAVEEVGSSPRPWRIVLSVVVLILVLVRILIRCDRVVN